MKEVIEYLSSFNLLTVLIRTVLAMLAGGIIGLERGKQGRAAGMRTHILVCMGAALTAMIGFYLYDSLAITTDPMRISAQVISGIGFLGVGTIMLKGRFQITGLTTAAGLWATATIGLAFGVGFYAGAFATFIGAVITVTVMHRVEYRITKRYNRFGIYVEIKSDELVRAAINMLTEKYHISDIQVTAPRSNKAGNVGIEANVHVNNTTRSRFTPNDMAKEIEENEYVVFALESI